MKINAVSESNPAFSKLKKVQCSKNFCTYKEELVLNELRKLAEKNNFFKDYDVNALIDVQMFEGALLRMECKPVAKTIKEKIKNLFIEPKVIELKKVSRCTDESSYYLAKELRNIGESNELYNLLNRLKLMA